LAASSEFCAMMGPAWLHSTQPGSAVSPAPYTRAATKAAMMVGLVIRHMVRSSYFGPDPRASRMNDA
jgi:hypothetical protein